MPNLIATLAADARFGQLHKSLMAVGMTDTLSNSGPFTLFAPTDNAFAHLSAPLARLYTRDDRAPLTDLMTFHAVAGKSLKANLRSGQQLQTIHGEPLHILLTHNHFCVNEVLVVDELEADNGFIYVIDTVLIPPTRPGAGEKE